MNPSILFADYLLWHYTSAFRDMLIIWSNLFWFVLHLFSIPTLLRTLFSPWKRITENHNKRGLEDFAATMVINIMTRIVGFLIRIVVIVLGLLVLVVMLVAVVLFVVFWFFAPFAAIFSLFYGLLYLF